MAKEFVTSETETSELETFDMPKELKKMPLVIQKMYTRLMSRKDLDDGVYVEVEPGILGPEKTETYIYPEEVLRLLKKKWLDVTC